MEGLMLSRVLRDLAGGLPARALGWVFPDETTAALLLEGMPAGTGNLVLSYRPPQPVVYFSRERLRGEPNNPFQQMVANKVRGDLLRVEQLKLDRVFQLHFGGEEGFVSVPPARLLFEVTGRNANLLILEEGRAEGEEGFGGRILHAAREITPARNRFRTTRSGGQYTPPPPYQKLDPRTLTVTEAAPLADLPLSRWREQVDGLGPLLSAELGRRAGFTGVPGPERLPQALAALTSLVDDPSVSEGVMTDGAREAARTEKAAQLRKELVGPLDKRLTLLTNQLSDVTRAEEGIELAAQERTEADILMAYSHQVPEGVAEVTLPDLSGEGEVTLTLDPLLSAVQNAEKRYSRARRREDIYERLAEREPRLRAEYAEAQARVQALETAGLRELEALAAQLETEKPEKVPYGLRFTLPSGLTALVGRNNKENATLTHRIGRSMDYWFHAQGYAGSHVLVRTGSGGRELSPPDILYAAQLAAAHSKARGSSNVPVDYTRIKHVWRPKGAAAGKVNYTGQKTVFVDGDLPEG
ncbi:Rqc2 family fibronectin-binding protein [Deinococcus proteolyticus]|nr:NFACT family protein [Deinococcus proteolyticus]